MLQSDPNQPLKLRSHKLDKEGYQLLTAHSTGQSFIVKQIQTRFTSEICFSENSPLVAHPYAAVAKSCSFELHYIHNTPHSKPYWVLSGAAGSGYVPCRTLPPSPLVLLRRHLASMHSLEGRLGESVGKVTFAFLVIRRSNLRTTPDNAHQQVLSLQLYPPLNEFWEERSYSRVHRLRAGSLQEF